MSQETILQIRVVTNADIDQVRVAALVKKLINAGLEDARSTIEHGDGDLEGAELATDLNISAPTVVSAPRALVVVHGFEVTWVGDEGVEVEVFDRNVFDDDPENAARIPLHFADLAEKLDQQEGRNVTRVVAPPGHWQVVLKMEDGREYQWSGEADDESHAEGQAIADGNSHTGQQVFETLSIKKS